MEVKNNFPEKDENEKPPILGEWRNIYMVVFLSLLFYMITFYLLTKFLQ